MGYKKRDSDLKKILSDFKYFDSKGDEWTLILVRDSHLYMINNTVFKGFSKFQQQVIESFLSDFGIHAILNMSREECIHFLTDWGIEFERDYSEYDDNDLRSYIAEEFREHSPQNSLKTET